MFPLPSFLVALTLTERVHLQENENEGVSTKLVDRLLKPGILKVERQTPQRHDGKAFSPRQGFLINM